MTLQLVKTLILLLQQNLSIEKFTLVFVVKQL